jgi:branched-chain amino acid transport system ATP-binding protein
MSSATQHVLEVTEIRKSFGGIKALDGVSFSLEAHEILGIIGPNGAGKSTLFDVISGFTLADEGTVVVAGEDVTGRSPLTRVELGLARTFQSPRVFPNASVQENVATGTFRHNRTPLLNQLPRLRKRRAAYANEVAEILERVGLAEQRYVLAADLSYGQQKILPQTLILDEPMAGLNEEELERMATLVSVLRDDGLSAILIEHHLSAVATLCERVVVIHHGQQIAFGPVEDVFVDPTVRNAYAPASA